MNYKILADDFDLKRELSLYEGSQGELLSVTSRIDRRKLTADEGLRKLQHEARSLVGNLNPSERDFLGFSQKLGKVSAKFEKYHFTGGPATTFRSNLATVAGIVDNKAIAWLEAKFAALQTEERPSSADFKRIGALIDYIVEIYFDSGFTRPNQGDLKTRLDAFARDVDAYAFQKIGSRPIMLSRIGRVERVESSHQLGSLSSLGELGEALEEGDE